MKIAKAGAVIALSVTALLLSGCGDESHAGATPGGSESSASTVNGLGGTMVKSLTDAEKKSLDKATYHLRRLLPDGTQVIFENVRNASPYGYLYEVALAVPTPPNVMVESATNYSKAESGSWMGANCGMITDPRSAGVPPWFSTGEDDDMINGNAGYKPVMDEGGNICYVSSMNMDFTGFDAPIQYASDLGNPSRIDFEYDPSDNSSVLVVQAQLTPPKTG